MENLTYKRAETKYKKGFERTNEEIFKTKCNEIVNNLSANNCDESQQQANNAEEEKEEEEKNNNATINLTTTETETLETFGNKKQEEEEELTKSSEKITQEKINDVSFDENSKINETKEE